MRSFSRFPEAFECRVKHSERRNNPLEKERLFFCCCCLTLLSFFRLEKPKPTKEQTSFSLRSPFRPLVRSFIRSFVRSFVPVIHDRYLVDPARSHMLVSKIKPCMSKSIYFDQRNCRWLIISVIISMKITLLHGYP